MIFLRFKDYCNQISLFNFSISVSGPNSANEWAREGRRIIPLLKRASVVTSLTEVANKAKLDIQSNNKILLPPLETKTFSKSENNDDNNENVENMFGKGKIKRENRPISSPPPPVEETMVKVRNIFDISITSISIAMRKTKKNILPNCLYIFQYRTDPR